MTWQILLAINIFAISLSSLFQKRLAENKKIDPIAFAIGFQLTIGAIIGIFAFVRGFHMPNFQTIIFNFILTIFLYSVGNITKFNTLKKINLSEFIILFQVSAITSVAVSVIFLKDKFLPINILGLTLILFSVILVSWESQKFSFNKGKILALITGICYGVAMANDAFIVRKVDVPSYLFFAFITPAIITWIIYFRKTKKLKVLFEKDQIKFFGAAAAFYAIAAICLFSSYQIGKNFARISAINATSTILTVILATIFLKERNKIPIKITAAILATIGVILLG